MTEPSPNFPLPRLRPEENCLWELRSIEFKHSRFFCQECLAFERLEEDNLLWMRHHDIRFNPGTQGRRERTVSEGQCECCRTSFPIQIH